MKSTDALIEELERPIASVRVGSVHVLCEVAPDGSVTWIGESPGYTKDITEALSNADVEKIERIVRRELKDVKSREHVEKLIRNSLVKLFKAFYIRRNFWKTEVDSNPE